jgi:uncharacterized protein YqgC (DUF456 family)
MVWIYFLLLLATDICGIALAAFTLPGLWLMLAGAAIYTGLTHGYYLGLKSLIALLMLATGAEIAEILLGGAGAKKAGASGLGILGGMIGAIIGGIVLSGIVPILGTIIGICLGSFVGAAGVEIVMGQPIVQSAKIGIGAAKGKLTGIVAKIVTGLAMFLLTLLAAFPVKCSTPQQTQITHSTTAK